MNLAELRKKAQAEKKDEAEAHLLPPPEIFAEVDEALAGLSDETVPDEEPAPLPEPASLAAEPAAAPAPAPAQTVQGPPKTFDPLALLMAGRESARDDEASLDVAEAAVEATGAEFQEFLCFRVATEVYAINILEIKEIIKPREVTEVPRAPAFVSGVLSLRGIIIPIFNMRLRLGLAGNEHSPRERIIVLKKHEEFFGILVDEVIQVVRIATETIEKPPAVLEGIDRDFVSGIGRFDGQMLILLNQEKILDLTLG